MTDIVIVSVCRTAEHLPFPPACSFLRLVAGCFQFAGDWLFYFPAHRIDLNSQKTQIPS